MAWDVTQQPWLVSFPDPNRSGTRAYEPAFSFPYDFTPDPPDTDVAKASKWQPTYPQPPRPIVYDTRGSVFTTWIYDPTHSDPKSQLDWYPNFVQPPRPIVYARGTDSVRSPRFQGIDLSPGNSIQNCVQPSRPVLRANGTDKTGVLWFPSVETYQPGWQQTCAQPQRLIVRSQGTSEVDPLYGFTTTTADRWYPTYTQPNRINVLPIVGTTFVAGPGPSTQDVASHFDFYPTYVQPIRQTTYDRLGTMFVTWQYDATHSDPSYQLDWLPTYLNPQRPTVYAKGSEARPTYFAHAVYAGDWQPTYTQPLRPTSYAQGSFTGVLPNITNPLAVWHQPTYTQPSRQVAYAKGTELAYQTWPVQNPSILADRWMPTFTQPSRKELRRSGFVMASGDYHRPGDPDPRRATTIPTSPDQNHSTSRPGSSVP